ncbi:putative cuticle protein [Ixodes scapularis]
MFAKVFTLCLMSGALAGDRLLRAGFGAPYPARFGGSGFLGAAAGFDPVYAAQPYSFGYDNVDEFGTKLFHNEQGDANNAKTGSYGYTDAYGLFRRVSYVADANGFRATVDTNEPGTQSGPTGDAVFNANPVVVGPGVGAASAFAAPGYAGRPVGAIGYGRPGFGSRW